MIELDITDRLALVQGDNEDIIEAIAEIEDLRDMRTSLNADLLTAEAEIKRLQAALQLIDKHLMLSCDIGAPGMLDVVRNAIAGKDTAFREDARHIIRAYRGAQVDEDQALDLLGFGAPMVGEPRAALAGKDMA